MPASVVTPSSSFSAEAGGSPDPVALADQGEAVGAQHRAHEVEGAGEAAADPGGADAGDQIEALLGRVGARVALDERDAVGDAQLGRAFAGGGEEDLADVHADPGQSVAGRPAVEHLGLAAREVELPGSLPDAADLAEQVELVVGDRIQEAMPGFGDLVEAQ